VTGSGGGDADTAGAALGRFGGLTTFGDCVVGNAVGCEPAVFCGVGFAFACVVAGFAGACAGATIFALGAGGRRGTGALSARGRGAATLSPRATGLTPLAELGFDLGCAALTIFKRSTRAFGAQALQRRSLSVVSAWRCMSPLYGALASMQVLSFVCSSAASVSAAETVRRASRSLSRTLAHRPSLERQAVSKVARSSATALKALPPQGSFRNHLARGTEHRCRPHESAANAARFLDDVMSASREILMVTGGVVWRRSLRRRVATKLSASCGDEAFCVVWRRSLLRRVATKPSASCGDEAFGVVWRRSLRCRVATKPSASCGDEAFGVAGALSCIVFSRRRPQRDAEGCDVPGFSA